MTRNNIALYNTDLTLWQGKIVSKPYDVLYVTEGCIGVKDILGYFDQIARFLNQSEAITTLKTAGYTISMLENGQVIAKA